MKRGRINPMSKKRKRENAEYTRSRARYLEEHQACEMCIPIHVISDGSHGSPRPRPSNQIHHRKGRDGPYYLDEAWWYASCPECHAWEDRHRGLARQYGITFSRLGKIDG